MDTRIPVLLVASLFFFAVVPYASASWADTDYDSRLRIAIQNNNDTLEFPIGSTFNISITAADLNDGDFSNYTHASCNNIRVWENTTGTWNELDRRIEYCETGETALTIWFKSPVAVSASGSNENFWIYHRNNTAVGAAPADWQSIYYLADDFEDGSINTTIWDTVTGGGTVQEGNGSIYVNGDTSWFSTALRSKATLERGGNVGFQMVSTMYKGTSGDFAHFSYADLDADATPTEWYANSLFLDSTNVIRFFGSTNSAGAGQTGNLTTRLTLSPLNGTLYMTQYKIETDNTETGINAFSATGAAFNRDNLYVWMPNSVTAGAISEFREFYAYYWVTGGFTTTGDVYENQPPPDVGAPTVTIGSPTATTYASTTVNLEVSADETIDTWWYSLNAGANTTFTPNTTIVGIENSNSLTVWANDTSGNEGQASVSFDIDTTAPTVTVTSPQAINYTTTTIDLSASSSEVGDFWYSLNGGANVSFTPNTTFTGAEGSNTIIVYSNDSVDNQGQTSVTFFVDSVAPAVTVASPTNTTYGDPNIALLVSADDSVDAWSYSLNGAEATLFTPNATTITAIEGQNNISVTANDTFGNSDTVTVYFTYTIPVVDTSLPTTYRILMALGGFVFIIAGIYTGLNDKNLNLQRITFVFVLVIIGITAMAMAFA